jgi:hypothetical protein
MTTMEITSKQLLTQFKEFMLKLSQGIALKFTYKGDVYRIVKEERLSPAKGLAQTMRERLAKKPVNTDAYLEDWQVQQMTKSMNYEQI